MDQSEDSQTLLWAFEKLSRKKVLCEKQPILKKDELEGFTKEEADE